MSESPQELQDRLQQEGRRYQALSPINQSRVHIQFPGHFQEQEIIWDAQLFTLEHEYRQHTSDARQSSQTCRQYIEISPGKDHLVPITVALNVPEFDEPAILKTMIMIHNYKRLRFGRHEFGEPVRFPE
ncbi:MAG: hypothetical protein PVG50_02175 [Thiohalophilus sp.]|jgi:hypothetical protein